MSSSRPRRRRAVSLVIWTLLIAALIRVFLVGVFFVPSQSMMPTLLTGDYFIATRWDYGWSPFSSSLVSLFSSKPVFQRPPRVGDVVIFSGVIDAHQTYVKRVMGLPGDVVQMRRGRMILNGHELPQRQIGEFVLPLGPNVVCLIVPGVIDLHALTADGRPGCKFLRYVELLPDGRRHRVLDFAVTKTDDFGPVRVPARTMFVMGDNRDDSLDSRIPITAGGLGMVPLDRLMGRARYIITSSDGTGSIEEPWTLASEFRPERIGPIH